MALILFLLNANLSFIENTVDPDQLASDQAGCSGSTQFSILIDNICLQMECCMLQDKNWVRV